MSFPLSFGATLGLSTGLAQVFNNRKEINGPKSLVAIVIANVSISTASIFIAERLHNLIFSTPVFMFAGAFESFSLSSFSLSSMLFLSVAGTFTFLALSLTIGFIACKAGLLPQIYETR